MKFLFDTHALLWAVLAPDNLSSQAAGLIGNPENNLLVSSASAWEIATKVRLGKLPLAADFERNFFADIQRAGYELISIDTAEALRAGRFPASHGDPFDRMIAAQAIGRDIPVISNDNALDAFGVRRVW